jgi:TolA-binding protein
VLELDRLIARVRQARGGANGPDQRDEAPSVDPGEDRLQAFESRVAHLEQLVQGLQDSVHREAERQAKRMAELEARTQPGALGKALSEDARARGL